MSPQKRLWAIVLAGGEGVRLRPLVRHVCGDERPKQYAPLADSRSLLRQTLDRVMLRIAPERTVVVTHRRHARYMAAEVAGFPSLRALVQPEDRGTGAGILFPAHWIRWRDPEAAVAVFPSDHFILEEMAFMDHVVNVAGFVERQPGWLVLLGARPTSPEVEYGWIEPGAALGGPAGGGIFRVRRFWEKPSEDDAWACFASGCLWNTFVFIAKVATLLEAGRQFLPDLSERLDRLAPFQGTEDEPWAVQQAYALAPKANFSRAVLAAVPRFLAVSALPALTWSDWGTPGRVLQSLRTAGISPPWLRHVGLPPEGRREWRGTAEPDGAPRKGVGAPDGAMKPCTQPSSGCG